MPITPTIATSSQYSATPFGALKFGTLRKVQSKEPIQESSHHRRRNPRPQRMPHFAFTQEQEDQIIRAALMQDRETRKIDGPRIGRLLYRARDLFVLTGSTLEEAVAKYVDHPISTKSIPLEKKLEAIPEAELHHAMRRMERKQKNRDGTVRVSPVIQGNIYRAPHPQNLTDYYTLQQKILSQAGEEESNAVIPPQILMETIDDTLYIITGQYYRHIIIQALYQTAHYFNQKKDPQHKALGIAMRDFAEIKRQQIQKTQHLNIEDFFQNLYLQLQNFPQLQTNTQKETFRDVFHTQFVANALQDLVKKTKPHLLPPVFLQLPE